MDASRFTHSLAEELHRAAEQAPDAPFLRMLHGEWTYGEVARRAAAVAAGLKSLGVRPGDRVSLLLPNGIEFLLAWMGLAWAGAIAAPVNTGWRGRVLADAVDLVGSELGVVHQTLLPELRAVQASLCTLRRTVVVGADPAIPSGLRVPASGADAAGDGALASLSWSALERHDLPAPEPAAMPFTDPALLLYTSGTTGRSKAACIAHRFVLRQAQGVIDGLRLRADDVLYCPYPMFHLDAAVMTIAPALLLRGVAAIGERFSASRYWDEVRALDATVFDFMGATLTLLWKQPPTPRDRQHRARLGWGVPMPAWAPQFEQRFGCRLVELYGSTEVGAILYTPQDAPPRIGSCGKPMGPFRVRLVDEQGFEVPDGTPGELLVRGEEPAVLMQGYWGMPEQTLEAFRDQWFHTGDLLRRDADGFYWFVGRRKDMVRRRGENISAAEVEQALEAHPDVLECAVIGVPSELTEEDVMAWLVPRPGRSLDPVTLSAWALQCVPRFMVPRYWRIVPALERTPTDKVEKFRLRQEGARGAWDREAAAAAAATSAPGSNLLSGEVS